MRLIGMEWTAESEETLQASVTRLKSCIGLDASGNNTAAAVVTGRVYVPSVSTELLTEINEAFPQLVVVANGVPQFIVRYLDWDNTVLYRAVVAEGANAVDAVVAGYIEAPTKAGTEDTGYTFKDFGDLPTNIHSNTTVVAQYTTTYRVRFMNDDTAYNTQWVVAGGSAITPSGTPTKASTAQYSYTFSRWDGSYTNITGPVDVTAVYTSTVRKYTVYFYNGSTLLQTVTDVPYGSTASYTGTTPVDPSGNGGEFEGWSPSNANIQGTTSCYAQFSSALEVVEITDDWATILESVADGTYKSKYKVGNYKPLDLGTEGTVNMQIAGFNKDPLADGSGYAAITWISKELLATSHRMNPEGKSTTDDEGNIVYTEGTGAIGGWEKSEMRTYLIETIKPLIPDSVCFAIKAVTKTHVAYNTAGTSFSQTTTDEVWLPDQKEIFNNSSPYKALFPDNASRIKMKVGATSASIWWLRSAYNASSFHNVYTNGSTDGNDAYYSYGVALGFCT